jgi:hypothetical protein
LKLRTNSDLGGSNFFRDANHTRVNPNSEMTMQEITKANGNIKASAALLRSPLVQGMRRERLQGLLYAIDVVAADTELSDFQKEILINVLSDAIAPETGGVW